MQRDTRFFSNVHQIETTFNDEPAKMPVFYYDNTAISAIFYAKTSVLRKFLPKSSYHPVTVMPGVGVIVIVCFEYRDTDIRAYNEVCIGILMSYGRPSMPLLEPLLGLYKNEFHVFVHHLPVTTQVALDGGVTVYNYPKFMSTIDFDYRESDVVVTLKENDALIFKLTGKKIPANQDKTIRYVTYPVKDDRAQHADVLLHAKKFGQSINPSSATLEFGEHAISQELRDALLTKRPMLYQYMPDFEAILYGPSRLE
jgi:hypothetical protein